MKFGKLLILLGTLTFSLCSFAMEMEEGSMAKYYQKFGRLQQHEYGKLKPGQIQERVNFLLTLNPSSEQKQEIDMLINKLQGQSPSQANALKEKVASSMENKKLVDDVGFFRYNIKRAGASREFRAAEKKLREEYANYQLFEKNINNITKTIKDLTNYLDKQKITGEIASKLAGNVNQTILQKIEAVQNYIKKQFFESIYLNLAPFKTEQLALFLHMPESASEKAHFKDALMALYNELKKATAAVSHLAIINPVGIKNNKDVVKDFIFSEECGLITMMQSFLDILFNLNLITEHNKDMMQKDIDEYMKNIAMAMTGKKIKPE